MHHTIIACDLNCPQARAQEVCVKLTNDYEERIETVSNPSLNDVHELE